MSVSSIKQLAESMADNSPDNPFAPLPKPLFWSQDQRYLYYGFDDGTWRFDQQATEWTKATVDHVMADCPAA